MSTSWSVVFWWVFVRKAFSPRIVFLSFSSLIHGRYTLPESQLFPDFSSSEKLYKSLLSRLFTALSLRIALFTSTETYYFFSNSYGSIFLSFFFPSIKQCRYVPKFQILLSLELPFQFRLFRVGFKFCIVFLMPNSIWNAPCKNALQIFFLQQIYS